MEYKKQKLLFICLGNICRSPAAEAVMKKMVADAGREDEFFIDSAGIGDWHVGQLPDSRMRQRGARRGYSIVVLFFNIGWIWLKLCGPSVAYVFVGGITVSIQFKESRHGEVFPV